MFSSKPSSLDLTAAVAGVSDEPEPEQPADQAPPQVDERHRLLAHQFNLPVRITQLIDLNQPLDQVFESAKALQRHVHDFDGGVRETAPPISNPAQAHNELLVALFNQPTQGRQWPN